MPKCFSVADYQQLSSKRLPKIIRDFLEGGSDSEEALARALSAFERVTVAPRCLNNVSNLDTSVTLFGKQYSMPVGVSPIGLGGLIYPHAEETLATIAQKRKVPYILSLVASASVESIAKLAPDVFWFQLYAPKDPDILVDLVSRAKRSKVNALVITVDGPVQGRRLRDMRNGFSLPIRFGLDTIADLAMHPRWSLRRLRYGLPAFESLRAYSTGPSGGMSLAKHAAQMFSQSFSWEGVKLIRNLWDGPLILKGIQDETDARLAVDIGVDGIIVSTHGGRQFNGGPASITALARIVGVIGKNATLMLDSGVRSGTDVVKAVSLGAEAVFSGRSFYYGLVAGGHTGAESVFRIFEEEIRTSMSLVGAAKVPELKSLQTFIDEKAYG